MKQTHSKLASNPLLFKAFRRNLTALPDRVTKIRKLNFERIFKSGVLEGKARGSVLTHFPP
jgi:hypothetical protein